MECPENLQYDLAVLGFVSRSRVCKRSAHNETPHDAICIALGNSQVPSRSPTCGDILQPGTYQSFVPQHITLVS
jgi:hypothetical protein